MGHSVGQTSDAELAIFCVRSFWDMQKDMGTSNTCFPQLEERILHALAYNRPSEPQVGRATLQHDSRQFRVLWQCFLLVRTFDNEQILYQFLSEKKSNRDLQHLDRMSSTSSDT